MDEQNNNEDVIASGAKQSPEIAASPSAPRNDKCPNCEEYLAGWKRAQADYQNLKKETEREKTKFAKYANERLLSDLLPALDQLELALRHVPDPTGLPDEERKKWSSWLIGIKAVASFWEQAAKNAGLERISTEGKFDPSLHEPMMEVEAEGKDSGEILVTHLTGWKLNGRVIRPAKVTITK